MLLFDDQGIQRRRKKLLTKVVERRESTNVQSWMLKFVQRLILRQLPGSVLIFISFRRIFTKQRFAFTFAFRLYFWSFVKQL